MDKKWYVLQVLTGKELDIKQYCADRDLKAFVPRRIVKERHHKKWQNVEKVLIPGYVFIYTDVKADAWRNYYILSNAPGVVRILRGASDGPEEVKEEEMELLFTWTDENDLIGISEVVTEGDRITVISGPLRGYEGRIQSINARRYRARVNISVAGTEKTVELAIGQVKKSEMQ